MPKTDSTSKRVSGACLHSPGETNSLHNILQAIADISDIEVAVMAESTKPITAN
jgi:hypothetical protein